MAEYEVRYERDESGAWVASVPAIQGCHTQGRTIQQAEKRIREALGLFVDDADTATLQSRIVLASKKTTRLLRDVHALRVVAEARNAEYQRLLREVARTLDEEGISRRDAGQLLDLTHQRVQQLIEDRAK